MASCHQFPISPSLANHPLVVLPMGDTPIIPGIALKTFVEQKLKQRHVLQQVINAFTDGIGVRRSLGYIGTPIHALFMDYEAKLKEHPKYNLIVHRFMNVITTKMPPQQTVTSLSQLFSKYFLTRERHPKVIDDRIMMTFLVAAELIDVAFNACQTSQAIAVFKTTMHMLTKGYAHTTLWLTATPFLMANWLERYDKLISKSREPCMITAQMQFSLENVNFEMIKYVDQLAEKREALAVKTAKNRLKYRSLCTVKINSTVPMKHEELAQDKWYQHDARVSAFDLPKIRQTELLLHSYILARLKYQQNGHHLAQIFSERSRIWLDLSATATVVAMIDYGNKLMQQPKYPVIANVVSELLRCSKDLEEDYERMLRHVLPLDNIYVYDRIMLVGLLTSELVNDKMLVNEVESAWQLYDSAKEILEQNPQKKAIVETGWVEMQDILEELLNKERYDLEINLRLLSGPPPVTLLSTTALQVAMSQTKPFLGFTDIFCLIPDQNECKNIYTTDIVNPNASESSGQDVPNSTGSKDSKSKTQQLRDVPHFKFKTSLPVTNVGTEQICSEHAYADSLSPYNLYSPPTPTIFDIFADTITEAGGKETQTTLPGLTNNSGKVENFEILDNLADIQFSETVIPQAERLSSTWPDDDEPVALPPQFLTFTDGDVLTDLLPQLLTSADNYDTLDMLVNCLAEDEGNEAETNLSPQSVSSTHSTYDGALNTTTLPPAAFADEDALIVSSLLPRFLELSDEDVLNATTPLPEFLTCITDEDVPNVPDLPPDDLFAD